MFKSIIFVGFVLCFVGCEQFDGCDIGWFRYEDYKCVYIFNFDSTYDESENYCIKTFGANILNITDDGERLYWSFHLLRYSNLSNNVWIRRQDYLKNTDQCLTMRSKYSNDKFKIGSINEQPCESSGTTVCEIETNKKLKTQEPAKQYNPNLALIPNKQIKFANGTLSQFYTGVYYQLTAKYKNATFSNKILGNGKCTTEEEDIGCKTKYHDNDIDEKWGNYYTFASDDEQHVQIRRFNSEKLLVYEPDKYLSNYQCGKDSLSKSGKNICKMLLRDDKADDKWQLIQFNNSDYYVIKSTTNNYTLGAKFFPDSGNGTIGFGLYASIDESTNVDDRFLFKIEELQYTLDVELYTISFDKSLEDIVKANKQQISIIDTAVITNMSPATLTHEVESTKQLTESFSTSYGYSEQFMTSISEMAQMSKSLSDSKGQSRSFTDSASHAVANTLSNTVTNRQSSSSETSGGVNANAGVGGSIGIENQQSGAKAEVNAHAGIGGELGHSDSSTSEHSNEQSNSHTTNDEKSHSRTDGEDNSHTNSHDHQNSTETTNQKSNSTDKTIVKSGESQRTYSIYKTVSLPPYSAVKISSYANWINDLQIPFNMTLKFTVKSFRRQMDDSGLNLWRTMDSEFVKHVMKNHLFNGDIKKEGFDVVYGELSGYLKASVGLESVFIAKEVKLDNMNALK